MADILEAKYGIMQFFWDQHKTEIMGLLGESIEGSFETIIAGGKPPANLFASASPEIEKLFQLFIDGREMDGKVPGVPTAASLGGVNLRFKSKRSGPRPSFQRTGLFESSFHFWGE